MNDRIRKDIDFYRKLLIPKLISRGDAGYKSISIAKHLERFLNDVERILTGQPEPKVEVTQPEATPEFIENLPMVKGDNDQTA